MDFTVLENGFIKISNFLPQELFDQFANSEYWDNEFSLSVPRENKHNDEKHLADIEKKYQEVFDVYKRIADKEFLTDCILTLDKAYPELKNANIGATLNIDLKGDRRAFLQSKKASDRVLRLISKLARVRKNFFLDLDFGLSTSSYLIPKHVDQAHKQFACVVYLTGPPVAGSNQGGFGYLDDQGNEVEIPLEKNSAMLFRNHGRAIHYTLPFDECENYKRKIIYFSLADGVGKNIQRS